MAILSNTFLVIILFIYFLIVFAHIGFYIWRYKYFVTHDNYIIHKHILDNVCDNYKKNIFIPKIENLRASYNLDPNSQINAIKAYENAEFKLLKETSTEIYKLLTKQNLLFLRTYYSQETLILIIINNLRA